MEKNNKGLADDQQGDFVLNESGTSVSIDHVEETSHAEPKQESETADKVADKPIPALQPGNE